MTSLYVDKHYVAQSAFEDIVWGGDLRDGMTVLIADDMMRADMGRTRSAYDQARADECNQWCEVTRLKVITTTETPLIKFVGVYPDGTMRVRTYGASHGWIVKRHPVEDAAS